MIGVSCKEELITERYEFLRKNMAPDAHFSIFLVSSWMEPWGFGRENKGVATKLYNEFMDLQGLDTVSSISESEYTDEVVIALRSQNEFGIVYVAEDYGMANEYLEDLLNYLIVRNTPTPIPTGKIPEPKKPDNLVIPKMKLFK